MQNQPSRPESLVPQGAIDQCERRYVPPVRVVWTSDKNVEGAGNLLQAGGAHCILSPGAKGEVGGGVVIDFGKELAGGVRIHDGASPAHRPIRVRIRFGESIAETFGTPNQDHAIHDYTTEIAWMSRTEIGTTGFRYVRIDLLDEEAALPIDYVEAVLHIRDMPMLGTFECSDARLNRIFQAGAWTVQLCCQDQIWDGIKRDRLVWIGDLHPEAMVVSAVFGHQPVVQDTLDWARDQTQLPNWINGIASYSMWWIICQRDWFAAHGNLEYLKQQQGYLQGLLKQIEECVDESGIEHTTGWRFLEWPTADDKDAIHAGLQAMTVIVLRAGAELCRALGLEKDAEDADAVASRAAGAQISPGSRSKQVNALLVLAGMADPAVTNHDILSVDPCRGISTWYGYYILQARAKAGDFIGALELIRRYWGGMLDAGATTFWEHFEIDWLENSTRIDEVPVASKPNIHADFGGYCFQGLRHSLCHGWAAGPTAWLLQHILGVAPASAGCQSVTIRPQLGDLEYVRGTYPTPLGLIRVEATRQADGSVKTTVDLPRGVRQVPG